MINFRDSIGGHGLTPGDSTNLILSVSQRKFFQNFQGGSPRVKKDSVHLTFNAFFHRKFSSVYIMVPGGPKGVV